MKQNMKEAIGLSLKKYNETYMKQAHDRIDNIVAQAGTDNTEIVDARIDSAGVIHTTLNNRILAETKMNDEQLITYTGNYISTEDTTQGYLKNIEILGNTIQNEEDLVDIRSVGEKVEGQELYEIPILSCGKNLIDKKTITKSKRLDNSNGDLVDSTASDVTDFIKIKPSTYYTRSGYVDTVSRGICFYDTDKKYISTTLDEGSSKSFITPSNAEYVRITLVKDVDNTCQLEEGTVATEYEPYVEDKITILSPTQLEKVGDVSDRIICKDGVWGVEKNVGTVVLNSSENWRYHSTKANTSFFQLPISPNIYKLPVNDNTKANILSNKFLNEVANVGFKNDVECIYLDIRTNLSVRILNTKLNTQDLAGFKTWLSKNPTTVKYQLATPQFIPLPHDQQVKLRTFANKTNISFLTEIEGTIKAQVPKSLGATVNTHTTQIGNLNKELDRVKKLEESTVSTVTTESNFTVVEQTSNGYFEDVKLEGRTLINLSTVKSASFEFKTGTPSNGVSIPLLKTINGANTLLVNLKSNTLDKNVKISLQATDGTVIYPTSISQGSLGGVVLLINTEKNGVVYDVNTLRLYTDNSTSGSVEIDNIIILEGDHTQNPPSYFEGLLSVGEDVEEIVVLSQNNGNMFDSSKVLNNVFINTSTGKEENNVAYASNIEYIEVIPKIEYSFEVSDSDVHIIGYTDTKECLGRVYQSIDSRTLKFENNVRYVRVLKYTNGDLSRYQKFVSGTKLYIKNTHIDETKKCISDKKQLLFYNTETSTWEKPILRQWDTIEKHSDGKYYYHKRSEEIVLNGSEEWSITSQNDTTICFNTNAELTYVHSNEDSISDKFLLNKGIMSGDILTEGFKCSNTWKKPYVRILKSRLSSQDITGFKQWLQANNVTVVYQLAEEKVYECTNIDLIAYEGETNYIVESGTISPKTTLKVHNNISNVVSLLQKKVSLLENTITNYMITQNRMQLASTYSADSVTFKVDYALCNEEVESYNEDLYNLILNNILVGKDNYNYDKMFTIILDYASWSQISWEQFDILVGLMDEQHNPPVEGEVIEEIPNEIM